MHEWSRRSTNSTGANFLVKLCATKEKGGGGRGGKKRWIRFHFEANCFPWKTDLAPPMCVYKNNACGIVDLYVPLFTNDDSKCLGSLTSYVAGREQLRVLRNYMLLNGVAYSIFNVNFLETRRNAKYRWLRIILVVLFIALSISVLISCVDPFFFIHRSQLVYSIIECTIFLIILSLLSFNLYKLRNQRSSPSAEQPPNSRRRPRISA